MYFDDLTKDLCYVKACLKKCKEDPDPDQILLNLLMTTIKSKDAFKEKIQGGLSSGLKDVFVSALYDENFHKLVDADLDLIGFNNGIYNIRTEEFFPYSKEYLVTKTVGYDF